MLDKYKKKIALGLLLIVLSWNFLLIPYLYRREAIRTVQSILKSWKTGNLLDAISAWENMQKSAPVYGLLSSHITKGIFDNKDGMRHAQNFTILEFTADNPMPSGKTWVFELNKTSLGWKVISFRLVENGT